MDPEEIEFYGRVLVEYQKEETKWARQRIAALTPEELRGYLRRAHRKCAAFEVRASLSALMSIPLCGCGAVLLIGGAALVLASLLGNQGGPVIGAILTASGGVVLIRRGVRLADAASEKRSAAREEAVMAHLEDPRCVGPLLEHLFLPTGSPHRPAMLGLCRLLARLSPKDGVWLTRKQRILLSEALRLIHNRTFTLAALSALTRVGDRTAIPAVERLAGMTARTPDESEMLRAAASCLQALRARTEQEVRRATLLRPARPQVEDSLVRPSACTVATDASALLRRADPPA